MGSGSKFFRGDRDQLPVNPLFLSPHGHNHAGRLADFRHNPANPLGGNRQRVSNPFNLKTLPVRSASGTSINRLKYWGSHGHPFGTAGFLCHLRNPERRPPAAVRSTAKGAFSSQLRIVDSSNRNPE